MRSPLKLMLTLVVAIHSAFFSAVAMAANGTAQNQTQVADSSQSLQQLLKIRQELLRTQKELDQTGYVSNATKAGLISLAITGGLIGAAGAAASHIPKFGPAMIAGAHVADKVTDVAIIGMIGSPVLTSVIYQLKGILNSNIRDNLSAKNEKLMAVMDEALASQELTPAQAQKILELKRSLQARNKSLDTKWHLTAMTIVEVAVVILVTVIVVATTGPAAIAVPFIVFPTMVVANIVRALDDAYSLYTQKKALKDNIQYIENLIAKASQGTRVMP